MKYLVGGVGNANIKGRELSLDHIAQQDLEFPLLRRALHTLGDLGGHSGIDFDANAFLSALQDAHRQVTGTGADFEDGVGGLEEGLFHDGIRDTGILENMLAEVCVELEDVVLIRVGAAAASSSSSAGTLVWRTGGAAALSVFRFGHGGLS